MTTFGLSFLHILVLLLCRLFSERSYIHYTFDSKCDMTSLCRKVLKHNLDLQLIYEKLVSLVHMFIHIVVFVNVLFSTSIWFISSECSKYDRFEMCNMTGTTNGAGKANRPYHDGFQMLWMKYLMFNFFTFVCCFMICHASHISKAKKEYVEVEWIIIPIDSSYLLQECTSFQ